VLEMHRATVANSSSNIAATASLTTSWTRMAAVLVAVAAVETAVVALASCCSSA
jgi:hypothetical protein